MVDYLQRVNTFFNRILLAIEQGATESESRMIPFGIFCLIASLSYYVINLYFFPNEHYESLMPRIGVSILSFFLVLKNYWPQKLRAFLPLYWYLTVLYAMPFFVMFMTLKNNGSTAWILNLLPIVILMMLLVDWISYAIILVLGALLAGSAYYLTTPGYFHYNPGTISYKDLINSFSINIIMGLIFSQRKEKVEQEKLQAMKLLSANITHELRTPLGAINATADGLQEYLPDLINTYELAKQHNISAPDINPSQIRLITNSLRRIKAETNFANTIVNMLLVNVDQSNIKSITLDICSIKHCINEALQRYPLHPQEEALITWKNNDDFLFKGKELFTVHILFNLIKNALYYIKAAGKVNVNIRLEYGNKSNNLYFRDTGAGIRTDILPRIFDRFFTKTYHGSGVGLAFCKMVMQAYGGDISCKSVEGEFTEFVLSFPVIQAENNH